MPCMTTEVRDLDASEVKDRGGGLSRSESAAAKVGAGPCAAQIPEMVSGEFNVHVTVLVDARDASRELSQLAGTVHRPSTAQGASGITRRRRSCPDGSPNGPGRFGTYARLSDGRLATSQPVPGRRGKVLSHSKR